MKKLLLVIAAIGLFAVITLPYFCIHNLKIEKFQSIYQRDSLIIEKDSIKKSNYNLNNDVRRLLKYRIDDACIIDSLENVIYKLKRNK